MIHKSKIKSNVVLTSPPSPPSTFTSFFSQDDLIGSATLSVPDCWYHGGAFWRRFECVEGGEYQSGRWRREDCHADDSLWAMEERRVCNATVWVNLATGGSGVVGTAGGDGGGVGRAVSGADDDAVGAAATAGCAMGEAAADACLLLELTVVPLAVEVTAKLGAAARTARGRTWEWSSWGTATMASGPSSTTTTSSTSTPTSNSQ